MSITQDTYAEAFGFKFIENGGVTSAKGFKASGIHAGFRENPNRLDMALVVADEPCAVAATFTQNEFAAAPVLFSKSQLQKQSGNPGYGTAKAVIINSGNANAATGAIGFENAEKESKIVAESLGCPADEVLVASTGVIGVQLPLEPLIEGMPSAASLLSVEGGSDAAQAIITTDTRSKECAVSFSGDTLGYPDTTFTVGGMAKGSGMIMPNMATMIAVITTDAPIMAEDLHFALKQVVGVSFNKITVDSDTSTNDTCFLFASGCATNADRGTNAGCTNNANRDTNAGCTSNVDCATNAGCAPNASTERTCFSRDSEAFETFINALTQVCVTLARDMARDGEGATKIITVELKGAASESDADLAARTVANSPLVKTAVAGRDANWGRIAAALGRSGASFDQENVNIDIMGIPVCRAGLALDFSEEEALKRFEDPEITIDIDLGAGNGSTTIWTCDLTHDYISINADYRS